MFKNVQNDNKQDNKNDIIVPLENINICVIGGVSTGKSTILNAFFGELLTECKIKRTTMVPTIYIENPLNNISNAENIYSIVAAKNKEIIKKTEQGVTMDVLDYSELVFDVGKLDIKILDDSLVNIYDMPGLNDARTKDVYYKYLEDNFTKFNLIILLVDIQSGLNTSDEMDMIRFVSSNVKHHKDNGRKIYTLVVVNKADDMQWNEESHNLELNGELKEIYEQVVNTVKTEFSLKEVQDQLIAIMPLCGHDAYLYRMIKKHGAEIKLTPEQISKIGINQMGKQFSKKKPEEQKTVIRKILNFVDDMIKLSGFTIFVKTLRLFLNNNDNNKRLRIDNIMFELKKFQPLGTYAIFELEFVNIIKQRVDMITKIKVIDNKTYDRIMLETLDVINILTLDALKTYKIIPLIKLYQKFKKNILDKYFNDHYNRSEYNDYGFSYFFVKHIITMIYIDLTKCGDINDIINIFDILISIGSFDKPIITRIIETIIHNNNPLNFYENTNEVFVPDVYIPYNGPGIKGTIRRLEEKHKEVYNTTMAEKKNEFVKRGENKININSIIETFIKILKQTQSLGVNVRKLMCYVLIQRYKNVSEYDNINKYMSYKHRNNIQLSTYLMPTTPKKCEIEIIGWEPDVGLDVLDLYYLEMC